MNFILTWLVLAVAVFLTAAILPGFKVNGFWGAIKAAAVFGTLNWLFGYFLYVVFGVATLGIGFLLGFITRWVVMALLLKLSDKVSSSIKIDGFVTALIGALLMTAIGTIAERLLAL